MARRKKVGAISTGTAIALAAGAGLLLYMMNKRTSPPVPTTVYVPVNTGQNNTTGQLIQGGTDVLTNLFNNLFS